MRRHSENENSERKKWIPQKSYLVPGHTLCSLSPLVVFGFQQCPRRYLPWYCGGCWTLIQHPREVWLRRPRLQHSAEAGQMLHCFDPKPSQAETYSNYRYTVARTSTLWRLEYRKPLLQGHAFKIIYLEHANSSAEFFCLWFSLYVYVVSLPPILNWLQLNFLPRPLYQSEVSATDRNARCRDLWWSSV